MASRAHTNEPRRSHIEKWKACSYRYGRLTVATQKNTAVVVHVGELFEECDSFAKARRQQPRTLRPRRRAGHLTASITKTLQIKRLNWEAVKTKMRFM